MLDGRHARLQRAGPDRPHAELIADAAVWAELAADVAGGLDAFRRGRLTIRRDLTHRAIALDLPGFGDSVKPLRAAYDAPYFARAVIALRDALDVRRADLVGNSMGEGRARARAAVPVPRRRLALLAPSPAWLRGRPFAPRNIYLEEPAGPEGLWTRLPGLSVPSLFVWGRRDRLVPIGFEPPVREALPTASHLELDCGHIPQLEAPGPTHRALVRFLAAGAGRALSRRGPRCPCRRRRATS